MQIHEYLKGRRCPNCNIEFTQAWWPEPGLTASAEELEAAVHNPAAVLLVVCFNCARILSFIPSANVLRLITNEDIQACPPELMKAVQTHQRQVWMQRVRVEANKMAIRN